MREIIESDEFRAAVRKLGGHRAIDDALEPIIEALYLNPYGFEFFQNDWVTFRFAHTKPLEFVPALVVIFTIDDNGNVILEHVEESEGAPPNK
jgi:hypothetical protein